MNSRTILILAVVTALVALAAVKSLQSRESLTAGGGSELAGESLFPDLTGRVNDAAAVTIASADGSFRLERSDDGWGAADKGGYPVDFEKVKAVVVGLAGFDVVEAKTDNPAYYAKLGVEDVDAEEASSTRVTVEDGSGAVLADALVGELRVARGRAAGAQSTQYARRAAEPRSYEVTGRMHVDTTLTNWLDKKIVQLERERVRRVEIEHPDGEQLVVFRESPDETNFTVLEVPEGRELMWDGVASGVGNAINFLNLEDVGSAGLVDFDAGEKTVSRFTTFDGLVVTVTTVEKDEKVYLRVSAAFDEAAVPVVATVEPPPEVDAEAAEGEEGEATEGEAAEGEESELDEIAAADEEEEEDSGKSPDEVRKEAEEINARTSKWTYVVPGYTATNLRKRMSELLKAEEVVEEEEPEVAAEPEPVVEDESEGDVETEAVDEEEPPAEGGE